MASATAILCIVRLPRSVISSEELHLKTINEKNREYALRSAMQVDQTTKNAS